MMKDPQSTTTIHQSLELSPGAKHSRTELISPSRSLRLLEMELPKDKSTKMFKDFMGTFLESFKITNNLNSSTGKKKLMRIQTISSSSHCYARMKVLKIKKMAF